MNSEASNKPRLLFLSHVLPYPPDSGVKIRTYHLLRLLAQDFDVTALCLYRVRGEDAAARDIEGRMSALERFATVDAYPIPQVQSRARFLWDHVRSVVTGRAYTWYVYQSSPFQRRLEELLQDRTFDLVHVDSLDLARFLPALEDPPVVCGHHNAESKLLERRADRQDSFLKRAYMRLQAKLTRRLEERWCPRLDLNIAVSEQDRRVLEKRAPHGRFAEIPNGVDVGHFTPGDSEEEAEIVFVGGTSWEPNKDAMFFFCEEVQPLLRERLDSVTVRWIGRAATDERRRIESRYDDVELTGYVEDIRPHVRPAACYVAPLRMGGGTRLKILDAWAMGKAVVSTSLGCEGLRAVDGDNILIRDDPEGFANAVETVLESPRLRDQLGRRARKTAQRHYSWEVLGKHQSRLYRDILTAEGAVTSEPEAVRRPDRGLARPRAVTEAAS